MKKQRANGTEISRLRTLMRVRCSLQERRLGSGGTIVHDFCDLQINIRKIS
jgi:hypothetical protein